MSEIKTKSTQEDVLDFIKNSDPKKIKDSQKLIAIMERHTGEAATMWGPSIIGFGTYHYVYDSGREGDMCKIGFSPRKDKFSLYVVHKGNQKQLEIAKKLGNVKISPGACIYFKKLEDIDLNVIDELIVESLEETKRLYQKDLR